MEKITKTEAQWRTELPPETFQIMRNKGTERPFSCGWGSGGASKTGSGVYVCAACDLPLFSTESKFDSGTGWPSFSQPIEAANVDEESDFAYGIRRTEVLCARCEGHLGHVFPDGPAPTGLRYGINGVALKFEPTQ